MTLRPLTEHHLEFLSLKGGCTGSSKSTLVKTPHCWKTHVMVHFVTYPMYMRAKDKDSGHNCGIYSVSRV